MQQNEAIPHNPEADSFDLRRSWANIKHAIFGHKLLVGGTTLLTLSLVIAYVVIWPPVYVAEVMIAAEPKKDTNRDEFYQYWDVFREDHLPDEAKLINSGPVLRKVIEELDLTYDDVYHPFLRYAAHLWVESSVGKTYRKIKYWIFPKKESPYAPTPEEIELARTLVDFKAGVSLEAYPDTNVGRLLVRGPSPRVADIANTLARIYLEQRRQRHVAEADKAYNALKAEVDKAHAELTALEQRMQAYYTDNSILLMFEKDKVEISQWVKLKASVVDLRSQIAKLSHALTAVNAQLAQEPREITSAYLYQTNALRESLQDRLYKLQLGLKQKLERYQPDSPEVKEIEQQIADIRALIKKLPETREMQTSRVLSDTYEQLRQRKQQLEAQLRGAKAALRVKLNEAKRMEQAVGDLPEKMRISHDMQRQHDVLEKKFTVLNEKLMVAAVSRASALSAPPSIRIVEAAVPPEKPAWPKTKLLLLVALFLGGMGGVVLALLVDLVHARVSRYRVAVAQDVLPVYAVVDQDRAYVKRLFAQQEGALV